MLAEDPGIAVRVGVAGNEAASTSVLRALAADTHPAVRVAAAENIRTPRDVLTGLAEAPEWRVRAAAAGNKHLLWDAQRMLVCDRSLRVRRGCQRDARVRQARRRRPLTATPLRLPAGSAPRRGPVSVVRVAAGLSPRWRAPVRAGGGAAAAGRIAKAPGQGLPIESR